MASMRNFVFAAVLLAGSAPALAADLGEGYAQCYLATGASLLSEPSNAALSDDVVRLMNEAVGVADDSRWINSRQPAFTWASEAKVACGKAYGYLKSNYRDDDTISKCECFHARMLQYMN
jgi:hypothetical protein